MPRLDQDRQDKLQPQRMDYARQQIEALGFAIAFESDNEIRFEHNGHLVKFFPYSGWHTGKSIQDGRGIKELLKQLR